MMRHGRVSGFRRGLVVASCLMGAPIFGGHAMARSARVRAGSKVALSSVAVKAPPVARLPLQDTPSWVLMDAATGRVLEEHDAHRRMFPASTTKTMTGLVAISRGDLDRVVTIGPNPPKTGEQSAYLMQGERFALRDLLRAALIKSANDSCVAVAEAVAGNVPAFVKMMNQKAREVGARDTHFANPHGLHDPNHYTTAYDLALIARAAMKYPFFNQVVDTREAEIHGNYKIGATRLLVNKNKLLFRWNECDGVKTGYTRQAGRCLIASATQSVQTASGARPFRLVSVVMHSPDSWGDSEWLLRQGFAQFAPVEIVRANQEFGSANVEGGAQSAQAIAPRAIYLPLRHGERAVLSEQLHFEPLRAPLRSGQNIGRVDFVSGGRVLVSSPLVSLRAVPVSLSARVMPSSAQFLPSDPILRNALYGGAGTLLLLLLWVLRPRAKAPDTRKQNPSRTDTRKNHASTHTTPIVETISGPAAQTQRQSSAAPRTSGQNANHQSPGANTAAANTATGGRISRDNATPNNAAPNNAAPDNRISQNSAPNSAASDNAPSSIARATGNSSREVDNKRLDNGRDTAPER